MLKVSVIIGTRPEAIKLIPVCNALSSDPFFNLRIISTGQHKEMLASVFDFFGLKADTDLGLMTSGQSLAQFTSRAIQALDTELQEHPTDLVIVQGDTTTAMTASLIGYYHQINVAHVEAGLRTENKYSPFPEEVNRRIISTIADLHFAPTKKAENVLIKEGYKNVFVTGNTTIDSLLLTKSKIQEDTSSYVQKFESYLSKDGNVLITGHRRESFGDGFRIICKSIKRLASKYDEMNFIYPVHLNPNVKEIVNEELTGVDNVFLIDPLPYDEMVFMMMNAKLILTDSGGIQEEAPSLDVPVVVMRNHTERMEGIEAGCSVLAGVSEEIFDVADKILTNKEMYLKMSEAGNPYGDGEAASRIIEFIHSQYQ